MGSFREMAFGTSGLQSPPTAKVRSMDSRLNRLQTNALPQYRKGLPIVHPVRPTDNSTNVIQYPKVQGIVQSNPSINGRTFSQLAIKFDRPPDQRNWFTAEIYVKGYRGNPDWLNVGHAVQSPAVILLERTGETIQIALGSRNSEGEVNDVNKAGTLAAVLS